MQVTRRHALVGWLVFVFSLPLPALGAEPDKTLSPYFFVEGGDSPVERLPLERTEVRVEVTGVIAAVTVTQRYTNRGASAINASYVFPASTRAAVHGLRMTIGPRTIEAKIKERQEARRTFDAAKREGRTAALLEQDRPNVFRMNVSNVLPRESIDVELRYTELLVPTEGTYELVYPTVVGPRYAGASSTEAERLVSSPYLHQGKKPTYEFALRGVVSTGVPLQELGSPSHRLEVDWREPSRATLRLAPGEEDGGQRDFVLRFRLRGKEVQSGLMTWEGASEKFFLLMVQPPARVAPEQIPPREYVFVVDVSGSMRGFPLDTAKTVLRELAGALRPQDRFNVLLFSGGSQLMAPASLPATKANLAAAAALIDSQAGGGGTELTPAIDRALTLPAHEGMSRTFVVVTDGFISAERAVFTHVRDNLGKANIFCFGIGSSVNRFLVEGIAKAGQGEPFVVTKPSEAAEQVRRFVEYVRAPVLTHARLEAEGIRIYDVEPAAIPDVLADRPVVVFGKYVGAASGTLRLTGYDGAGPYRASFEVGKAKPLQSHEPLRYLWARTRIANLADYGPANPAEEVTQLGLSYNLLTQYTSFIAVSEDRRAQETATDVDQPLPLPEGVTDAAVGDTMAKGAEPELVLVLGAALALAALEWARRRSLA